MHLRTASNSSSERMGSDNRIRRSLIVVGSIDPFGSLSIACASASASLNFLSISDFSVWVCADFILSDNSFPTISELFLGINGLPVISLNLVLDTPKNSSRYFNGFR